MSSATGCLELLIGCQCWAYPDALRVAAAWSTPPDWRFHFPKPTENVFADAVAVVACRSVRSLVGWEQRMSIINFQEGISVV